MAHVNSPAKCQGLQFKVHKFIGGVLQIEHYLRRCQAVHDLHSREIQVATVVAIN